MGRFTYGVDELGLTLRERLLCEHLIAKRGHTNYTEAGKAAGFSVGTNPGQLRAYVTRALKRPNVKKYMERRMKEAAQNAGIDVQYLFAKLKKGADISIPDYEDIEDIQLRAVTLKNADVRAGVACISEINKMMGNYEKEKEADANEDTTPELIKQYTKDY